MSPSYVPMLRAKQGELQALGQADARVRAVMTPFVDLVAEDADSADAAQAEIDRLVMRLRDGWGTTDRVVIDVSSLGDASTPTGQHVVEHLSAQARSAGVLGVPAVWLTASAVFVREVAAAAATDGRGACIRVTTTDLQDLGRLAVDMPALLTALALAASDVDLVIDMGLVDAGTVGLHAALLSLVLPGLPLLPDWRTLTLASGAFPVNLDAFSAYVPGSAPRLDAALWRRLAAGSLPRVPSFGDYGVTHPTAIVSGPWRGAPNLRYTVADDWLILKGSTRSPRGNYDFHDLCAQVAAAVPNPLRPATFSWGDAEINRCATGVGGPGGGTQWRAWATSHHLAEVSDRLATLGGP